MLYLFVEPQKIPGMVKIQGRFLYHCHLSPPQKTAKRRKNVGKELPEVRNPEVRDPDPMPRVPAYEA